MMILVNFLIKGHWYKALMKMIIYDINDFYYHYLILDCKTEDIITYIFLTFFLAYF